MERYLYEPVKRDLKRKMVILTGPCQVGKRWLAKKLMAEFRTPQYLNFDNFDDTRIVQSYVWPLNSDLVVFDEIHKMTGDLAALDVDPGRPEVDFAIAERNRLSTLIEVKLSDDRPAQALRFFRNLFPESTACQIVHTLRRNQHSEGVDILNASEWLSGLSV